MKKIFYLITLLPTITFAQYTGTASVTQGVATTTLVSNFYNCSGGRVAGLGTITASNSTVWTVPGVVNFTNSAFPFASDLNNPCNGNNYTTATTALAALDGSDIVSIDSDGEVITAYVYADNYFEMYINGTPVGKDKVPYTPFNSSIVRFKVKRPFTIAMLLIDWEEHLGLGSEAQNGSSYHDGDAGMVAIFKDVNNSIVTKTNSDWKAQTFYTAPITDLTCPTESGTQRLSGNCSTANSSDGASYYGLHWSRPDNWTQASFDDSAWPSATTFTNETVGVGNQSAYNNFTNIFDDASNDAQFIWSTNLILDNEVVVRHTVAAATSILDEMGDNGFVIYPNPAKTEIQLGFGETKDLKIKKIGIYNALGEKVYESNAYTGKIVIGTFAKGIYQVNVTIGNNVFSQKLVIE